MRQAEKEITDQKIIEEILYLAEFCHIAMVSEGLPYLIPMNFVHHNGRLYLHSATEGKKIEILRLNKTVAFAIESDVEVIAGTTPCNATMRYRSVIGSGNAEFITEPEEKRRVLQLFSHKYAGIQERFFPDESVARVEVIEIFISEITGKRSHI